MVALGGGGRTEVLVHLLEDGDGDLSGAAREALIERGVNEDDDESGVVGGEDGAEFVAALELEAGFVDDEGLMAFEEGGELFQLNFRNLGFLFGIAFNFFAWLAETEPDPDAVAGDAGEVGVVSFDEAALAAAGDAAHHIDTEWGGMR